MLGQQISKMLLRQSLLIPLMSDTVSESNSSQI